MKLSPALLEFVLKLVLLLVIATSFNLFFLYYNAHFYKNPPLTPYTPLTEKPMLYHTPDTTIKMTVTPSQSLAVTKNDTTGPWGVAQQINDVTWTMKVANDKQMATPQEILDALNVYRQRNGREKLSWNDNLARFAQDRATLFTLIKNTDEHAGFKSYLDDENNAKNLGFYSYGENSSYGYTLVGVHLIEWIFAGDKPHNDNQLDPTWTDVGIGVSDVGVDLIFAKDNI